jgi:hypothetical protein
MFLHLPSPENPFKKQSVGRVLWNLDPIGLTLFMGATVSLLIALQVRWRQICMPTFTDV